MLSAVAAGSIALSTPSDAGASRAKRADSFVESVGVNVHLGYNNTPYGRHDLIQKKLRELGVRYVRDGLALEQPAVRSAMRALASCGIRVNLIVGDPMMRWGTGTIQDELGFVRRDLRGAVASLEGPNEYDAQGDPNWVPTLRDYQRRLYQDVKSDPVLRHLPVLGPSFVHPDHRSELGNISRWLDYGNLHSYPGGQPPDKDYLIGEQRKWAKRDAGSKRVQATETGYHNGVNGSAGHLPATEHAAGLYMPRLFLDYFRRGIARTFAYELIDQFPDRSHKDLEANFGLLRNNFSEKPAFVAMKRLLSLLRDPGPRFKPGTLDYAVDGAPPTLHRVLLQKRDGSFYLALWDEDSVWDPEAGRTLHAASDGIRLRFPRAVQSVEVYRPNRSGRPLERRRRVRSLKLEASAGVAVVKIVPNGKRRQASLPACASRRRARPVWLAAVSCRLRRDERRVLRALTRLRKKHPVTASTRRRIVRLKRWLRRRARKIRRHARHVGWAAKHRRVRYRTIRRGLRTTRA